MAHKGVQLDQETFSCSICLDLLKDPVTVPCGHSYCMNCIKGHWDKEEETSVYSCPQCRQKFTPRPVLEKSTMLAAPVDHCYAGPEDVACDVCSGRKLKACKSCLQCVVSYCEKHLQPHYEAAPFKKHKLVEPSKKLQENICSLHDEVMKMFCRTDQQSICYLCSVDEHKGHDTVSAAAERSERQTELEASQQNPQQRIQDRGKDVKLLQQQVEDINLSADKAVEHSEQIFTQLIRLMEERRSDVKQQVRSQREAEVSRVRELQEKLEQEIRGLKRRDADLDQLSNTEDHNYKSLSALGGSKHSSSINIRPLRNFEAVTAAVSSLRDKLQDLLTEERTNISQTETGVNVLLPQGVSDKLEDVLPEEWTNIPQTETGVDILLPQGVSDKLQDLLTEEWTNIPQTETGVDVLLPQGVSDKLEDVLPEEWTNISETETLVDVLLPQEISDKLEDVLPEEWTNISETEADVEILLSQPEPKTRAEFLQYTRDIKLDPNTANKWLLLSDGDRTVRLMREHQPYSPHKERFIDNKQVLSRESLTGRRYWEVEWRGQGVCVAVAYKNISRAGMGFECGFGYNDKSWALYCDNKGCNFYYNRVKTPVSGRLSSRVGVYLDHGAGILSFYSVCETMTLLHRVQTTFSQPLYTGIWLYWSGSTAEFCKVK